jgi:hypothetical protein
MTINTSKGERHPEAHFVARGGTPYLNENINGLQCRCGRIGKLSGLVEYRVNDCLVCNYPVMLYLTGKLPEA